MSAEAAPRVICNPLSGERIVIASPGGNEERLLAWELFLSPGGRVPNSHLHPHQEECFSVRSGQVRFRVGRQRVLAQPGDAVAVPAGKAHHFANCGPGEAHVSVETSPPLRMVAMFEAAACMARQQQAEGRALPHLADLALFIAEFEAEVASPYLPRLVARLARPVAWLAQRTGHDERYRRLRRAEVAGVLA
jgi:mannose-6-phosphate isomerase-like protein (cupin superfamily)